MHLFRPAWLLLPSLVSGRIDRKAVLSKFNVIRTSLIDNSTTPLQVGNGDFAYSADNTGMQTIWPYNTLSSWAWHNDSLPDNGEQLSDYTGATAWTQGRNVTYDALGQSSLPAVTQWLTGNSNRVNLGRIGLKYHNDTLSSSLITDPYQELDLWNGAITSSFKIDGVPVKVVTQGDFDSDTVAFRIESDLVASGALSVGLDFPFPPLHSTAYKYEFFVGSYDFPLNHTTSIVQQTAISAHIHHEMQETKYYANLRWPSCRPLGLTRDDNDGTSHRYTLSAAPSSSPSHATAPAIIAFSAHFSPQLTMPDPPATIQQRNRRDWNAYWTDGGFVDLTMSSNPNATELQRRIVLSQYLVRVNSAAKGQSPQESGLVNNGWYGKFHFEMFVWHNAHWVTWGRKRFFDRIFPSVYYSFLPSSYTRASNMGWSGARWPKMTEIFSHVNSPGSINAYLMWQQPHTMYLAELAYQSAPTWETLQNWDPLITAAADYMASFAWKNSTSGFYDLVPPAYGVTENTKPLISLNLGYEVAYWRYGLDIAQTWKKRLRQHVSTTWSTVAQHMALPPVADDGLYTVFEGLNSSWWTDSSLIADPRSVVMLKGILPDTAAVDFDTAAKTADKVAQIWTGSAISGWGRQVLAVNAARLGKPERAIFHLTAYDYFKFDDAGFDIRNAKTTPPFIAGNAAFLYAVAYAVVGWQGYTGHPPGFPQDGTWIVKSEGLMQAL